ncbi:hypothetical protein UCDDA912_g03462 [Diaporthe ampelina]|uniref:Uncharacterized protein n=1 Tax=Diaporthe ampelina TaxID=1214573 RepID=A0A0G2FQR5_9PEZI|nr:hypothetical protein UCDDA912_g03462 [Diaporthe ampelina]
MSDKKTPDNKKTANKSRSTTPHPEESPSPLAVNSFTLAPTDRRTSNPRFGAIGGPTQDAPPPFRHVTSLASLSATTNQRALQSNQPGTSYVTSLPTWRRGSGQDPDPRAAGRDRRQPAEDQVELYKKLETMALERFSGKPQQAQNQQQRHPKQQLIRTQSQGFNTSRGLDGPRAHGGGTGQRELFRPMNSKLDPGAASRPLTEEEMFIRDMKGISYKYQGETGNPANASANVPDSLNCSLWITSLPPDCSYHDLLSAIAVHRPGKVYATFISPPSHEGAAHLPSRAHSAAKVIFYQPWAAQRLLHVARARRLVVRGHTARAVQNRIRAAPQDHGNATSRVLTIEGPASIVDRAELARIWSDWFSWHDDEVIVRGERVDRRGGPVRRIEWRFGSHRAQAVAAAKYMWDHHPYVQVEYAADPCDVQVYHP